MTAYYNENDPFAVAWLRELIKRNLIAPGVVDDRSIEDVKPDEIKEFTQCHFFAGIGVWSYALRAAGWPDDKPVWSGSCPCQPFSAAGKGKGFADERHLWPAWHWLISEREPVVVFGEQVASKDGLNWVDTVQTDLENALYAFAATDLCAAGVGAPHIRQRFFFVAERLGNAKRAGLERHFGHENGSDEPGRIEANPHRPAAEGSGDGRLASANSETGGRDAGTISGTEAESKRERPADGRQPDGFKSGHEISRLAIANRERQQKQGLPIRSGEPRQASLFECGESETDRPADQVDSRWADVDWLGCRDGKFRPVEPGTFPLVDGPAARVGRLRGYGNAINAEVARVFIESYMDYEKSNHY